ncbi:hypothetical protein [Paenibacillus arenilitoris]|uniref:Uncharacterized protein n=1 Tax=Paenibacillus arenilitoris TaxID=2772299 RepID=A0A927H8Y3_9BACL|nr:hypothetical protein [Paenibacillus arenilitoris]MBD2872178.1 hypothetical protein [Paenibacillus arenilitoris]
MATQMPDPKRMIIGKMAAMEPRYNGELRMLRSKFSSPGYHTQIKQADFIHSTRDTMIYALALLDTELPEYEQRAYDMIGRIVSLQDRDRSRDTFGIWSWFYEEPLERMAPPDWNWADFIGKQLVLAVKRHGHRFPAELRESVVRAIGFACDAIIKRDVGPSYTNIAIMGAFVTMIAGELLGQRAYAEYGLRRLTKLYEHTEKRQVFQEYNSPTYTQIAILELSKIMAETASAEAKRISGELLRMTWKTVAEHFHAGTKQWSGPHSRCYNTLLNDSCKAFLQIATGGKLSFFPWDNIPYDTEWYKSGIACPPEYSEWFVASEERELRQLYAGEELADTAKWATTWMRPHYSLGSFDHEILWNQKRALLAYVDNGGEPAYAHLRFLHDGYDYCSAVLKSRQRRGDVLFGIDFLANGGDTHPGLDRIDGRIEASDFRIRLELGGRLAGVRAVADGSAARIIIGQESIDVHAWFAAFREEAAEERAFEWEVNELGEDKLGVDLVVYSGERRTIDFRKMREAGFVFSLRIGGEDELPAPSLRREGDRLTVTGSGEAKETFALSLRPVEI